MRKALRESSFIREFAVDGCECRYIIETMLSGINGG
jgi:hypothetical protein